MKKKNIRNIWLVIFLCTVLLIGAILLAVRVFGESEKPADVIDDTSAGLVFDEAAEEGSWENLSREDVEAKLNE